MYSSAAICYLTQDVDAQNFTQLGIYVEEQIFGGGRNVCSYLPPLFSLAYFLFSSRGISGM